MDWENHLIKHLQWSDSIINREAKEHVAREIAATAKDGDVIGAGSGSTVYLTLFELSRRIREEHLHIEVIPASQEISMTCIQASPKLPSGTNGPTGHSTEQTK